MNPLLPPPEGQNGTPHFNGLTGPGFEKMIFDLIRAENPGGDFFPDNPTQQEGSDMFFTRKDGKRVFIECKGRQDWFSGSELKKAVDKFLSGEMSHQADVFCVITSGKPRTNTKEAILQAQKDCKHCGIKFEWEFRKGLWRRLREFPEVVQGYLGHSWADESRAWCEARLAEYREKKRREQPEEVFSGDDWYRFKYGYFIIDFFCLIRIGLVLQR